MMFRKRPIVHVDHPLPHDPPRIDGQAVAVVDVIVQHRGQQVVGQFDGVEIAGEVQIDVLHRHHLGVAAPRRTALHAETGAQRRLAQADAGLLADPVQGVAQADAGRGLAFAGGRGRDRGDQHQLAGGFGLQAAIQVERHFGLVLAVMFQVVVSDAQLSRDFVDGQHFRLTGDFDVGRQGSGGIGHGRGQGSGFGGQGSGFRGQGNSTL